ncbi:MAG: hypothetical protein ACHQZQ_06600 [SAR324 cluster bacterium]
MLGSVFLCALAVALLACAAGVRAQTQPNFKPLERGDLTETEQKLLVIRGIETGGDYAMLLRENQDKGLQFLDRDTTMNQDFRLRLNTTFNEDVAMYLTVQTATTSLDPTNLRGQPVENVGHEANGLNLQLIAREAYLKYRFNPNSAIDIGQFDRELGDKRGKVYHAIASGVGFNCRVGTWCMPFGAIKVGPGGADWIYDWALRYNAYDEPAANGRRYFSTEIFRIIYTENNIPLGNNLGPASYDRSNPECATRAQLTDDFGGSAGSGCQAGNPLFYDATSFNYFGLRLDWQPSTFFLSFDATSGQGSRTYHLFRDPSNGFFGSTAASGFSSGPIGTNGAQGPLNPSYSINGYAAELETGWRWAPEKRGQFGLRLMSASGDPNRSTVDPATGRYRSPNGAAYSRGLNGYYEITPGTYQGTRLYFNGADTQVDLGGGLGHSVNNKQVWGFYLNWADPEGAKVGYMGGLYQISLANRVLNTAGKKVDNVGVELDNMLVWYIQKRLSVQFEANLLSSGGAMSIDDNTPPLASLQLFVQALARVVYSF